MEKIRNYLRKNKKFKPSNLRIEVMSLTGNSDVDLSGITNKISASGHHKDVIALLQHTGSLDVLEVDRKGIRVLRQLELNEVFSEINSMSLTKLIGIKGLNNFERLLILAESSHSKISNIGKISVFSLVQMEFDLKNPNKEVEWRMIEKVGDFEDKWAKMSPNDKVTKYKQAKFIKGYWVASKCIFNKNGMNHYFVADIYDFGEERLRRRVELPLEAKPETFMLYLGEEISNVKANPDEAILYLVTKTDKSDYFATRIRSKNL